MSWIDKIPPSGVNKDECEPHQRARRALEEMVKRDAILYKPDLERNAGVSRDHHMRIGARRRLELCLDQGASGCLGSGPVDHLKFKDKRKYRDRLTAHSGPPVRKTL